MNRYTRQVRLSEIGERGQERIMAAEVHVTQPGFAGEIEARYLAGAGVGTLVVRELAHADAAQSANTSARVVLEESTRPEPAAMANLEIADSEALLMARGARAALRALRALIVENDSRDG